MTPRAAVAVYIFELSGVSGDLTGRHTAAAAETLIVISVVIGDVASPPPSGSKAKLHAALKYAILSPLNSISSLQINCSIGNVQNRMPLRDFFKFTKLKMMKTLPSMCQEAEEYFSFSSSVKYFLTLAKYQWSGNVPKEANQDRASES